MMIPAPFDIYKTAKMPKLLKARVYTAIDVPIAFTRPGTCWPMPGYRGIAVICDGFWREVGAVEIFRIVQLCQVMYKFAECDIY
jgi:hypothetical protein